MGPCVLLYQLRRGLNHGRGHVRHHGRGRDRDRDHGHVRGGNGMGHEVRVTSMPSRH